MKLLLPILAMVCTVLSTLSAVVFCLAAGANPTPERIRALQLWMVGFPLLGVAGAVVGITLMRVDQPGGLQSRRSHRRSFSESSLSSP